MAVNHPSGQRAPKLHFKRTRASEMRSQRRRVKVASAGLSGPWENYICGLFCWHGEWGFGRLSAQKHKPGSALVVPSSAGMGQLITDLQRW